VPEGTRVSYCSYISSLAGEQRALHASYHDQHYGFPIHDDNELFCRLVLEINQAGLSWETILKKQDNFRKAYNKFNIKKVSLYSSADRKRLMADAGIVRNRLKINAAIENAKTIVGLQREHGSFERWLQIQHPTRQDAWVKLFKKTFRFTGGEIVREFLTSIGFLPGAHDSSCPIYPKVLKAKPTWLSGKGK
jgi:DNA-3-methyladenine glycosylase I